MFYKSVIFAQSECPKKAISSTTKSQTVEKKCF